MHHHKDKAVRKVAKTWKKRLRATGGTMTVKVYDVLCQAVESGVHSGYNRAFKHCETPGEAEITDAIYDGVMNSLCEWFLFGDEDD